MLINRSANKADSLKYFALYTKGGLGACTAEKNGKSDTRRSLLRAFLGLISYVQQFFALNRIAIVAATRLLL